MSAATAYDEVRYSNYPYAQTHPDRLATVAGLYGLPTPDPATARVLEIGCGAGGNLIAMATATPGITALGVDLASGPVADGRATIEAIGIDNIELRQGDISDLRDGGLGEFDYVIAHGVYAWVPEPVRDDLLAAIHAHLAADGLAYVSYNANPGGYMRRALRDAGLWYAGDAAPGLKRAERAKSLYRFLFENRAGTKDWWGGLLESQLAALSHGPTYRLVHDDLSEHWAPVWFADFVERAAGHGLADVPEPAALRDLHFAARPSEPGDEPPSGLLASAVELLLSHAPDTVPFADLRAATASEPDALCDALHDGFLAEIVMPHRAPLRHASPDGVERPAASPLARWQARDSGDVTTLAYTTVHMEEPAARLLLTLLDGTRDRAAIRAEFRERTGVPLSASDLDTNLEALGRLFLLTG